MSEKGFSVKILCRFRKKQRLSEAKTLFYSYIKSQRLANVNFFIRWDVSSFKKQMAEC